jgi:hypothetical protein
MSVGRGGVKVSGGGEGGAEEVVAGVISLELSLLAGLLLLFLSLVSLAVKTGEGNRSCDLLLLSTSEGERDTAVRSLALDLLGLLLWLENDPLLLVLLLSMMEGKLIPGLFLLVGSCDVDMGGSSSNFSGWSGCCCSLGGLKCCENMIWDNRVSARAKKKKIKK